MGKVLAGVGAAVLVVGLLLGLAATSQASRAQKQAEVLSVTNDYLPGGELLGIDEGEQSPERLAAESSQRTWQRVRSVGWIAAVAGLGLLATGAALLHQSATTGGQDRTTQPNLAMGPPRTIRRPGTTSTGPTRTQAKPAGHTAGHTAGQTVDQPVDQDDRVRASLQRVDALRAEGVISDAEHAAARARILDQL